MANYEDVTVLQKSKVLCYCEEFRLSEDKRSIEFRNVTRKQNLWAFGIQGDFVVLVWMVGTGDIEQGRFHFHGVTPGTPTKPDPNYWYGAYERIEAYGAAAYVKPI